MIKFGTASLHVIVGCDRPLSYFRLEWEGIDTLMLVKVNVLGSVV